MWTQVEVALRGGGEKFDGEVSVIAPDGDGVPGRASKACQILPGQETKVRLVTRIGRVNSELAVELRAAGRLVARKTFRTGTEADGEHFLPAIEFRKLIVVVGDSTLAVEEVGKSEGVEPKFRPVAARLDDVRQLPTQSCCYEGVDAVILSTSRPEIYARTIARGRPNQGARPMGAHGRAIGAVRRLAGGRDIGGRLAA